MLQRALSFACLVGLVGLAPIARAERSALDGNYAAVKLTLGITGSGDLDSSSVVVPAVGGSLELDNASAGWERDLEPSFGVAGQYMWDLHRYFALGGLFGVWSWRSDVDDADRNLAFDLAIVPQGRLRLSDVVELYVSVPIGLTLDLLNQFDREWEVNRSVKLEGNTAVGFTLSALVGARFALTRSFGVLAEVGYTYRTFSHEIALRANGNSLVEVDADISLGQLALNIGAFF